VSKLAEIESTAAGLARHSNLLANDIARVEGARSTVAENLRAAAERAAAASTDAEILEEVLQILQGMERAWQRTFEEALETVVSDGLSTVFGERIEIRLESKTKGDLTALEFRMRRGELETGIEGAQGGGYAVVTAFLVRVLLIMAARPALRRLLVLDEPFAQVSPEFRRPVAELVGVLTTRLKFQLILITHEREFVEVADAAYQFELVEGAKVSTTRVRTLRAPSQ